LGEDTGEKKKGEEEENNSPNLYLNLAWWGRADSGEETIGGVLKRGNEKDENLLRGRPMNPGLDV